MFGKILLIYLVTSLYMAVVTSIRIRMAVSYAFKHEERLADKVVDMAEVMSAAADACTFCSFIPILRWVNFHQSVTHRYQDLYKIDKVIYDQIDSDDNDNDNDSDNS